MSEKHFTIYGVYVALFALKVLIMYFMLALTWRVDFEKSVDKSSDDK